MGAAIGGHERYGTCAVGTFAHSFRPPDVLENTSSENTQE